KGSVSITPDSLKQNDRLNFTIAPDEAVPVLIVEPPGARENQGLYLSRALQIGDRPRFRVDEKSADALTPRDFEGRSVVVLDEVNPPAGAVGARLRALIDAGLGLVVVPGSLRPETWSPEWRSLVPATVGGVVDRTGDVGGTLSSLDYAHPVFEL